MYNSEVEAKTGLNTVSCWASPTFV